MDKAIVISGKQNVDRARLLILRSALKLEVQGLKHSRGSIYAQVKREFGFKGNKQKVLDQLNTLIDETVLAEETPIHIQWRCDNCHHEFKVLQEMQARNPDDGLPVVCYRAECPECGHVSRFSLYRRDAKTLQVD